MKVKTRIVGLSGINPQAHFDGWSIEKINNYSNGHSHVHTDETDTAPHEITGQPDSSWKVEFHFKIIWVSGHTKFNASMGVYTDADVLLDSYNWNNINEGEYKQTLYFNWQEGTPPVTPSYLETLDKLDQWSSAQYVPRTDNADIY